ncbi:hypothetical protein [Listeria seeligeri]|uniref:hypothetical protein n=1 Tax=Listeria seeligeri TaxID=1640 RepID=UPI0031CC7D94
MLDIVQVLKQQRKELKFQKKLNKLLLKQERLLEKEIKRLTIENEKNGGKEHEYDNK